MKSKYRKVGVLILETRFPRLPGDIGNPDGFHFPIAYKVVRGASPHRVVREQTLELLEPFIQAGHQLVEEGAEIITTSCGFLRMFQEELQDALTVPVFSSSLLLLPNLEAKYGRGNVGILTISKSSMSSEFLAKAKVRSDVPIGSTENGTEFTRSILENRASFDQDKCREDIVDAAKALIADHPNLKSILLECTNMPPYADMIEDAVGLPVYSLNTLLANNV